MLQHPTCERPLQLHWLARGEHELPAHDEWLTEAERERLARMRFTKRRMDFLVARWSAKSALAQAVVERGGKRPQPETIEIRHAASGAPRAFVGGEPLGAAVSLTDRAGWGTCLVAWGEAAVGCDLELVEPRSEGFVRDYLTAPEQGFVGAVPDGEERWVRANLLWSAKESVLKVLETGLRRDTRSVEIAIDGAGERSRWQRYTATSIEGETFFGWWVRYGVFVLTVAARQPHAPPVRLAGGGDLATAEPTHSWRARPRWILPP